jgi:hypothetical protein
MALSKEPDAKPFSKGFQLTHGIGPSSSIKASLESLVKKGILARRFCVESSFRTPSNDCNHDKAGQLQTIHERHLQIGYHQIATAGEKHSGSMEAIPGKAHIVTISLLWETEAK